MAGDEDLFVSISANYASYDEAMRAAAERTRESAAAINTAAESMATGVDKAMTRMQRINQIPIIMPGSVSKIQEATAATQDFGFATSMTAEEMEKFKVANKAYWAQFNNGVATLKKASTATGDFGAAQKGASEAIGDASYKMGMMERIMVRMAVRMALMAAVIGTLNRIKEGLKEVSEENKGIAQTDYILQHFGAMAESNEPIIRKFAESMGKLGVPTKDVNSALREVAPAAGSVANEFAAAKLALDLASTGLMSTQQAAKLVRDLLEGNPSALKEVLKTFNIEATNSADALQKLHDKFGGLTEKIGAQANALDRLGAKWKGFWNDVGQGILNVVDPVDKLKHTHEVLGEQLDVIVSKMEAEKDHGSAYYAALTRSADEYRQELADIEKQIIFIMNAQDEAGRKAKEDIPAPTPTGNGDRFGTDHSQEIINKEAAAIERLSRAYADVERRKFQIAQQGLKEADNITMINAYEEEAVNDRLSLLDMQIRAIKDEESKELKEAYLTDTAREAIRETALMNIVAAEEECEKDITGIRHEALTKRQKENDATVKMEAKANKEILDYEVETLRAEEAADLASIALRESYTKQNFASHQINSKKEVEQLQKLETNKYEIKRKALLRERELQEKFGHDPAALSKIDSQIEALTLKHWAKMTEIQTAALRKQAHLWTQFSHSMVSGFAGAIRGVIMNADTLRDAMKSIAGGILDAFLSMGEQLLMDWIAKGIESVIVSKTSNMSKTEAETSTAAMGAASAVAPIPFVGPALAIAAAAAMEIMGQGYMSQIASASGGFDIPLYESPFVHVHGGEKVLPKEDSDVINSLRKTGAGPRGRGNERNITNIYNLHVPTPGVGKAVLAQFDKSLIDGHRARVRTAIGSKASKGI